MNRYHSAGASASAPAPIGPKLVLIDDDPQFEEIIDAADLVASFARSIAEAAFRRDTVQIRIYRAEFRRRAAGLMESIRDVAPLEGGRA